MVYVKKKDSFLRNSDQTESYYSKCENYSVVSDSLNNLISDLTNRCTELEKYINKFSD